MTVERHVFWSFCICILRNQRRDDPIQLLWLQGSADDSGKPSSQPKERKQLSSINNEEDIDKLHVRELKEILVNNFVVIRGLCEKDELVQKTKMLWRQEIGQRRAAAAMKAKFNDHEPNISEVGNYLDLI